MNGLMHRGHRHRHLVTLSERRMDEEGASTPVALGLFAGFAPRSRESTFQFGGILLRDASLRDAPQDEV